MAAGAVSKLRKQLEKLSAKISRQRDILKDLENQKSAVEGELNAILDPMSRLPLEISSDIMLRCLPDTPNADRHAAPMLFLNVCHAWSNVALSTPSLWVAMRAKTAMSDDFRKLMELWVSRARTRPLSLSLHGSMERTTPSLGTFLGRYLWGRVQTLELYLPSIDQLRRLKGPFPDLHALTIGRRESRKSEDDEDDDSRNVSYCVEMLSAAPNLVDCTLHGIYLESAFESDHSSVVIHSNLKHLYLGGYHWDPKIWPSSAYILQYLTLPSLERLTISECDIEFDDLLAFLSRSSPPLQSLCMLVPSAYFRGGDSTLEDFLRLLPKIADLNLAFFGIEASESDALASLMRAICSPLLPALRNLTIRASPPQYEEVLSALSARRTASYSPMKSYKFEWYYDDQVNLEPSPDVIAAFRRLVEDGMQIHVGTPKRNFI